MPIFNRIADFHADLTATPDYKQTSTSQKRGCPSPQQ